MRIERSNEKPRMATIDDIPYSLVGTIDGGLSTSHVGLFFTYYPEATYAAKIIANYLGHPSRDPAIITIDIVSLVPPNFSQANNDKHSNSLSY